MSEVAILETTTNTPLTVTEMRSQVDRIQGLQKEIMQSDVHFGVIPGTNKPTLYKAGSEILLTAFHIAVDPIIEDLSTPDEIRYRVRAQGIHQGTGTIIGVGVGECSTNEEKYKWRRPVCDEEFDATDAERRRIKFVKSNNKVFQNQQVRTNPADLANTVLKMAKKRAQVDLCLTSLAASDIFDQDLEDMPQGYRPQQSETNSAPKSNHNDGFATQPQIKLVSAKCDRAKIKLEDLCKHLGIKAIGELKFSSVNDALAWIEKEELHY